MFVSMLAIMFDVKDYVSDHASRLLTVVVRLGLRRAIFFIPLPLLVVGLLTFVYYAVPHDLHIMKIILE